MKFLKKDYQLEHQEDISKKKHTYYAEHSE